MMFTMSHVDRLAGCSDSRCGKAATSYHCLTNMLLGDDLTDSFMV
jgi:hypothetical protein